MTKATGFSILMIVILVGALTLFGSGGGGGGDGAGTNPVDLTAPIISNISTVVTGNRVAITFDTDEPAESEINYWIEGSSDINTITDNDLVTEHEAALSNLTVNTIYHFTVTATDYFNNDAVSSENTFTSGDIIIDVTFTIDSGDTYEISPFIYGTNYFGDTQWGTAPYTLGRAGGNRWTAYNWENNASNSGSDWATNGPFENDDYLGGGDTPGEAVRSRIETFRATNAAAMITIPILGYVAATKNGVDVRNTPDYLNVHFDNGVAAKSTGFVYPPDTTDYYVYQDEFINFINTEFPGFDSEEKEKIFFCLDNEPELWNGTHSAIHPAPVTPGELTSKTIEYATAIKNVVPGAEVFSFVSYGFGGFYNLQGEYSGEFIPYYLSQIQTASTNYGSRLVDVIDIHWYSEAYSNGTRVIDINNATNDDDIQAIVQAPRSFWDPDYNEGSWISGIIGEIRLIPRLKDWIQTGYPGTKIAITEYHHGGPECIAGGIAQADTLGIFGREGVYAATMWELNSSQDFIHGAFNVYLNYDGADSQFGDTGLSAGTDDYETTSIYASRHGDDNSKIIIIAINKENEWNTANIQLTNPVSLETARVYLLDGGNSTPYFSEELTVNGNNPVYSIPPLSVAIIELTP